MPPSSSISPSALVASCVAAGCSFVIFARKLSRKKRTREIEAKLEDLNIVVPESPAPKGNYVSCVQTGNMLYLCGHIPTAGPNNKLIQGTVGDTLSTQDGYDSARACAMNILGTLNRELGGDWGRIKRIVKVVGFVNCTNDFQEQPKVINGASDLFAQVFGERGVHARSAVGTNALPLNITTEVECVVEIEP